MHLKKIVKNKLFYVLHPSYLIWKLQFFYLAKKYDWINCKVLGKFKISDAANVYLGKNFVAKDGLIIETYKINDNIPTITFGDNCILNINCYFSCANKISIGSNCLFGCNVFVTDNSHGGFTKDELKVNVNDRKIQSKGSVNIGNNVWIGKNVCIMSGVSIGDNTVIGANSVVTHSLPSNCMACGAPAKIIKQL